jgi:hypothetical protein
MAHETGRIRGKAFRIAAFMAALMIFAGCAGLEPFEPRDNREEGPKEGLFTGSQGEWVILGPKTPETSEAEKTDAAKGSKTGQEEMKQPEKSANGE